MTAETEKKKVVFSFWPTGLIIFIAMFVLFLLVMIFASTLQRRDLVTGNYYDEGLEYQQQRDRIEQTLVQQRDIEVVYRPSAGMIILHFPLSDSIGLAEGKISMYRPSNASLDRSFDLAPDSEGNQVLRVDEYAKGLWRLKISWKEGDVEYYTEKVIVLK